MPSSPPDNEGKPMFKRSKVEEVRPRGRRRRGRALAVLAGGLAAVTLLTSCSAAAPVYIYGHGADGGWIDGNGQNLVQPDWMDQPALWRPFSIPQSGPLGTVRLNAFIAAPFIEGPTPVGQGVGNGRPFDSKSDAFASKVSIELDFNRGLGRVTVTESCATLGFTFCLTPHPFSSNIGVPGTNGFRVIANTTSSGGIDVYLLMSAENAFSQVPGADFLSCSIDVGFHVWTDQGTVRATTWAPFNAPVDPFPSLEGYWYDGLGRPAVTLFTRPESSRGPRSLCDQEYHS
jgi:hypothetical protein